jgi:hypothetical protein
MVLDVTFKNKGQRTFFYFKGRNQCFSGGFNNGKTFIACVKAIALLLTFSAYRIVIARLKYVDLKRTTMQTFFSLLPAELIESHNDQEGVTILTNGSLVYWMHLDNVQESSIRGLEPNTVIIDQAEEISEKSYDLLDSRVGRWAGAIVPQKLLDAVPNWPLNAMGKHVVPSYHMILVNPDTQFHFVYRKYHPDSLERRENYQFVEGEWDPELGSLESYNEALLHDSEWVDKYVRGKWGLSSAQIHYVPQKCLLGYSPKLLQTIREEGNNFRILDHGDSSPTCCLWLSAINGVYIFYREYYAPGKLISYHRKAITNLSGDEEYTCNYADPSIFHKASQKDGGMWSVADEYRTKDTDGPPLIWLPADNNEFATRNRINELLKGGPRYMHPITQEFNSPGIYFMQADSADYPNGCRQTVVQLGSQRKKFLGTIDGKSVYTDDRDPSITDHAYDCVRYGIAMHGTMKADKPRRISKNSFAYFNQVLKKRDSHIPIPGSSL